MKIAIGTHIKKGPWGGGNSFAINLKNFLLENGHEVVHKLNDDDIDVIIMTDPRKTSETSSINRTDIKRYLKYIKANTPVIHRINECDERRGTDYINSYYIDSNKIADATVFVSEWLKELYLNEGIENKDLYVVKAGANKKYFSKDILKPYIKSETLKIVTHHWGTNINKGFAVYEKIDDILEFYGDKSFFSFTYIGNLPKKMKFKKIKHINPINHDKVGNVLKKYNVYLTASLNEPSGNHHIEALSCGLPILFVKSGGTTEYCQNYGLEFSAENIEEKIKNIWENYSEYQKKVKSYKYNSDDMCQQYLKIIQDTAININKINTSNKRTIFNEIISRIYRNYKSIVKFYDSKF